MSISDGNILWTCSEYSCALLPCIAIILFKAYKCLVFRLPMVLYFIVADIFQAITHIIELTPVEHLNRKVVVKEGAEGLCGFYGFLDQSVLWVCKVAIIWIMLSLLWKVQRVQREPIQPKTKYLSKLSE